MLITIIDNYDSFVFNLVRYLEETENNEIIVMKNDAVDWEILDKSDGILLSPGPGLPNEAGNLMQVISRYHDTKNILGVCLGHQALAEFYGLKLKQTETLFHGKSSQAVLTIYHPFFKSIPKEFSVGRYHSWTVSEVNSCIETLAQTDENEIMAIAHNKDKIIGVQFHPESILTPSGRQMINNWVQLIKK